MKKLLLLILAPLALTSCSLFESGNLGGLFSNSSTQNGGDNSNASTEGEQNSSGNNQNNQNQQTGENGSENGNNSNTPQENDPVEEEQSETNVKSVSFPKRLLDIDKSGKTTYLAVNYNPDPDTLTDEEKAGTFASSNPSVATVDDYGRLIGVSEGNTVITFTTSIGHISCSMTVYVHISLATIQREYIRVENVDDIQVGDELIFACPDNEFKVAASVHKNEGEYWVAPTTSLTFVNGGEKLANISEDVAEFLVCPGKDDDPDCFTLQIQDGRYLAGKITDRHPSLYYFKNDKAQIDWVIEKPQGFNENFVVNYDIDEDYWLMFNKTSNGDIRFNMYDSSEQTLMKKPTIYRNTIIR